MKRILALTLLSIFILLAVLYFRLGAYKPVEISQAEEGPFHLITKRHVGAYHKIVPVIEEVEKWVKSQGEPCRLSMGEYLDDVSQVSEDRLQSNGGCLLEKAPKEDLLKSLPEGYTYRELPRRNFATAEFDGAPSIGPIKVYPKVEKFMQTHQLAVDGPVMEVYEVLSDQKVTTKYYFPVRPHQ